MFRTAILRSSLAARSAIRPATTNTARRLAVAPRAAAVVFAPRAAAWSGVRCYSAAGGLNKEEVEGRIKTLLQGFDKVRYPTFYAHSSSASEASCSSKADGVVGSKQTCNYEPVYWALAIRTSWFF